MTSTREHTLASIAADAGTTKRTVQRWHRKATSEESSEIGKLIGDTRYFNSSEKSALLQYQSQRHKTKKTLEIASASLMQEHGGLAPQTQAARGSILMVTPCKLFSLSRLRLIFFSWKNKLLKIRAEGR